MDVTEDVAARSVRRPARKVRLPFYLALPRGCAGLSVLAGHFFKGQEEQLHPAAFLEKMSGGDAQFTPTNLWKKSLDFHRLGYFAPVTHFLEHGFDWGNVPLALGRLVEVLVRDGFLSYTEQIAKGLVSRAHLQIALEDQQRLVGGRHQHIGGAAHFINIDQQNNGAIDLVFMSSIRPDAQQVPVALAVPSFTLDGGEVIVDLSDRS